VLELLIAPNILYNLQVADISFLPPCSSHNISFPSLTLVTHYVGHSTAFWYH